jgi:hypothetical protein
MRAQGSAKGRDPNAPKPNRTPFNFFSAEARPKAKAAFPDLPQSEITKKVRASVVLQNDANRRVALHD